MIKDILGMLLFIALGIGVVTKIFFMHFTGIGIVLLLTPVIALWALTEQLMYLVDLLHKYRRKKVEKNPKEPLPDSSSP
tara:strand:- start:4601 stop:4837 length:237 start_codon:yes stop_codon:yes gene_type:complete